MQDTAVLSRLHAQTLTRTARDWPSLAAGGTGLALVTWLAFQVGGYFPPATVTAGAIAFAALGVVLVAQPPRHGPSASSLVAVGSLAGLAAWTGISTRWSLDPDAAVYAMRRAALYVALFGLGLVAVGSGRYARLLVWGVLVVVVVVAGAGLLSRFAPDWLSSASTRSDFDQYRLNHPLSYWNTFGALSAFGAVLALGLAADPRTAIVLRCAATAAAIPLSVAMYLSFSRGAWLAMGLGLVVLVALGAHRGSLLLACAVVGGAATLAILQVHSYPALVSNPASGAGQMADGHRFLGQLATLVVIATVTMAVISTTRSSSNLMHALRRVFRSILIGLATLAALAAAGAYAVKSGPVEGVAARSLNDTSSWVSRQWDDFLRPAAFSATNSARLTTAKGTRSDLYRVAFDGFEAHALRGDGAGAFSVRWTRSRRVSEDVINAHSLELETLGELGVPGGLLLLGFLGSLIVAGVRSRMRPGALPRAQSAAVAGACAVWVGHSFVDWDWQMPAFTGLVLLLSATLFPLGRGRRKRAADSVQEWAGDPRPCRKGS